MSKKTETALAAIQSAKEQYDKAIETHLAALREEKKTHLEKVREIDKLIEQVTGRPSSSSSGASSGTRMKKGELDRLILGSLKDGTKTQAEIEQALGKKNIYLKLQAMVKSKTLSKSEDETRGVLYGVKG